MVKPIPAALLLTAACQLVGIAGAKPIQVPFELYHDSVLVQVKVNGKGPFNMLLDTGVNPSVIDRATAQAIGLKVNAHGEQGSGSGSETNLSYETSLPEIALGELQAGPIEALATNLSKISQTLGKPLHGVLGYSLLKNRVVQFDYPKQVARFYSSSPYAESGRGSNRSGRITLPFTYRDDILVNGILLDGKKVTTTFDTGSNSAFQITPAAVAQLGLEKEARAAHASQSVGFNGTAENRKGTVASITMGGMSIDKPEVTFFNKGAGYDDAAWGLRVGNGFLKKFIFTVDYQQSVLTLERPD